MRGSLRGAEADSGVRPGRIILAGLPKASGGSARGLRHVRTYVRMSYVELHCHSAFSFLDGASHPVELANAAAEQGHEVLALTDHDGLHGAMEMAQALSALGIRPITGAELTLADGHHLTLLCEDARGYRNLCRLLTEAYARDRLEPSIPFQAVARHTEGLVCLTGCARDGVLAKRIERNRHAEAR